MLKNDELIATLNGLITTCKDGQDGYNQSAEIVAESELKTLFYQYSKQRDQFAIQLQEHVRSLGGTPEKAGSISGALHRGWVNLKAAISSQDTHLILAECESSEDAALQNYREALKQDLPAHIASVVRQQMALIQQTHDRIRSLRNQTKAAKANG